MTRLLRTVLLGALCATGPAFAAPDGTLVDVARGAGSFRTLTRALAHTGLDEALRGPGPFTVFAPTDEAFAALPAGVLDTLLAQPDQLRRVLLHHVARAARSSQEVAEYDAVTTLAETRLPIGVIGGRVHVGAATVIQADVRASNGVIHVIDRVLVPEGLPALSGPGDLVEVARGAGSFQTLLRAAEAAGLVPALTGEQPLTVFAPNDDAFRALPPQALAALLADETRLAALLTHHVVPGRLDAQQVGAARALKTLAGTELRIDARDGVYVSGAQVLQADVQARNGVIHVIDRVLLPPVAARSESSLRFPTLEGNNLEGRRYRLPTDLDGERNLCIVAFQQWHQLLVNSWLEWLDASPLAELEGFRAYELPTVQDRGEGFRRFLDAGMAAGIPSRAARERTITLYTDKAAFLRDLGIANDRTIQLYLLDREGNVLWQANGEFSRAKAAELARALGIDG